jgi:purine-binding chemotaxis protein CheW
VTEEPIPSKRKQILTASRRNQTEAEAARERVEIVVFTLAGNLYAFHGRHVKEILPDRHVTFVPGCPDFIAGIINVRGDIESVLDLHALIHHTPGGKTETTKIVIGVIDDIRSGIRVDSVEDVIEVPADLIKRPIATLDRTVKELAVGGETLYENRYVTILDIGKIFESL